MEGSCCQRSHVWPSPPLSSSPTSSSSSPSPSPTSKVTWIFVLGLAWSDLEAPSFALNLCKHVLIDQFANKCFFACLLFRFLLPLCRLAALKKVNFQPKGNFRSIALKMPVHICMFVVAFLNWPKKGNVAHTWILVWGLA